MKIHETVETWCWARWGISSGNIPERGHCRGIYNLSISIVYYFLVPLLNKYSQLVQSKEIASKYLKLLNHKLLILIELIKFSFINTFNSNNNKNPPQN